MSFALCALSSCMAAPAACGSASSRRSLKKLHRSVATPRGRTAANSWMAMSVHGSIEEYGDECEGDDYVPLALAKCYTVTGPGKIAARYIIEPVTAGSLESLTHGAKTTYEEVVGVTLETALQQDNNILPIEFKKATFCEDFEFRAKCATRTWLRPHPQENLLDIVPIGESKGEWNFDETNKRILNFVNEVNDDDNIKQDMSIDAYDRSVPEEPARKR